ncbi:MAG: hypothetical protein KJN84_16840 [Bacteroidia bacterium]|nr:hypothetical protein [Bacteroidia bacterium]
MKPIDTRFLELQFKEAIYSKNSTEFQTFFEDIMTRRFDDFQIIRPYGSLGDGGNDGFIKSSGTYYQVYGPLKPQEKDKDAADKCVDNFTTLLEKWNQISKVLEYKFVFNDKYLGSSILLEKAISKLEKDYPHIKFQLFLSKHLKQEFFSLAEDDWLSLNFAIDSRDSHKIVSTQFNNIRSELDKGHVIQASQLLNNLKDILPCIDDPSTVLEYKLLEAQILSGLGNTSESKEKYSTLSIKYPDDPRAFLFLAEIAYDQKNGIEYKALVNDANSIDDDFWLTKLITQKRKYQLDEFDITDFIAESKLPTDSRAKSSFYTFYAHVAESIGNTKTADDFINKAIKSNPDSLKTFITKLALLENRMMNDRDEIERNLKAHELLNLTSKIEVMFSKEHAINKISRVLINAKILSAVNQLQLYTKYIYIIEETVECILDVDFDQTMESVLTFMLSMSNLPNHILERVCQHILSSEMEISDSLAYQLFSQFCQKNSVLTNGKQFFIQCKQATLINLIEELVGNSNKLFTKLRNNLNLAQLLVVELKELPLLRERILTEILDEDSTENLQVKLQYYIDIKDNDSAFKLIQNIDFSSTNILNLAPILKVVQAKSAWEMEQVILQRMVAAGGNDRYICNSKHQLFYCYLELKSYKEAIELGRDLLENETYFLAETAGIQETIISNTLLAYLERGKVDSNKYSEALDFLSTVELTKYEFKIGVEAEIYIKNSKYKEALHVLIEAIKNNGSVKNEQLTRLYFLIFITIGKFVDLSIESERTVVDGSFLKFEADDSWYFVGHENEMDAIKISPNNDKYTVLTGARLHQEVDFSTKYSHTKLIKKITHIYNQEKYILFKIHNEFHLRSKHGVLDGIHSIDTPVIDGKSDLSNITDFLQDSNDRNKSIFQTYISEALPFSILAKAEGSVINAIGKIVNSQKGFIRFCAGTAPNLNNQKDIAKRILSKKEEFYIDGTSALFMVENGLTKMVLDNFPKLKIPQSVISFLIEVSTRFSPDSLTVGFMSYSDNGINFQELDPEHREIMHTRYLEDIKLLESQNVVSLTMANKTKSITESEMFPELVDATVLARNECLPVLTEDYLFLKANELEIGKTAPENFSLWSIFRTLYESCTITFKEFLDIHLYLSVHRFSFLSISHEDLYLTVFGESKVTMFEPENIHKLNLSLVLSEEYGVSFESGFLVIGRFLYRILTDNTIDYSLLERVFIEIIESLPIDWSRKETGNLLIGALLNEPENQKQSIFTESNRILVLDKLSRLLDFLNLYNFEEKIWLPK